MQERVIKTVRIEPLLMSLGDQYKDLRAELLVLDKLQKIVIDGINPSIDDLKTEEILAEAKQWMLEMKDYFEIKPILDKLMLIYTKSNIDKVKDGLVKEMGDSAWQDYQSANSFRSFLRQRLNDAIGFREFAIDRSICEEMTMVAFIREPARGRDKIAIMDDAGEILYKTKFKDVKKAVLLTNTVGYIEDKQDRQPLVKAIKKVIASESFRTEDNSVKLNVKYAPNREKQYQICCEDSSYILHRILPKKR